MANQRNENNPLNNVSREREAPSRAKFQEFQQMTLQAIQRLQETLQQMQTWPIRNQRDDDTHDDDGI
jgi:hypothetical protein